MGDYSWSNGVVKELFGTPNANKMVQLRENCHLNTKIRDEFSDGELRIQMSF